MKVKCIAKEPKQDKENGKWYIPGTEYDVSDKRGKELVATKHFVEVKEGKAAVEKTKQTNDKEDTK